MADDMDVPPLEDLSSVLQKLISDKDVTTSNGSCCKRPVMVSPGATSFDSHTDGSSVLAAANTESGEISKQSHDNMPHQCKTNTGFGGMKKGFLFSSSSKPSCTSDETKSTNITPAGSDQKREHEDIPYITQKKESSENQNRFDEVQQAMQVNDAFALNREWMTDDLLNRIHSNSELCQRLQDPTFLQAVNEFQANPQAAMQKYRDNAAMQAFFRDFCALLGEHFTSLGDKHQPVSGSTTNEVLVRRPEDSAEISVSGSCHMNGQTTTDADVEDARVREILSDSKMCEMLMDSNIQQLMTCLRRDPDKAQMLLQNADIDLRGKINCLVKTGLLQFQS